MDFWPSAMAANVDGQGLQDWKTSPRKKLGKTLIEALSIRKNIDEFPP